MPPFSFSPFDWVSFIRNKYLETYTAKKEFPKIECYTVFNSNLRHDRMSNEMLCLHSYCIFFVCVILHQELPIWCHWKVKQDKTWRTLHTTHRSECQICKCHILCIFLDAFIRSNLGNLSYKLSWFNHLTMETTASNYFLWFWRLWFHDRFKIVMKAPVIKYIFLRCTERKKWSRNGSRVETFSCPQDGPM